MSRDWTTHGYWIGDGPEPSPRPADAPPLVARCMGPGGCSQCALEYARRSQPKSRSGVAVSLTYVRPKLADLVHYTSFGTPGGEYSSQCRAAIVAEVGQWITVEEQEASSYSASEGRPIRTLTQWYYDDAVALVVLNPAGLFFSGAGTVGCKHDEANHAGGTWHWPESD
jgi:hypothetical protein